MVGHRQNILNGYLSRWEKMAEKIYAWMVREGINDPLIEQACLCILTAIKQKQSIIHEPLSGFYHKLLQQNKDKGQDVWSHIASILKDDSRKDTLEHTALFMEMVMRMEYEYDLFHLAIAIANQSEGDNDKSSKQRKEHDDKSGLEKIAGIEKNLEYFKKIWIASVVKKISLYRHFHIAKEHMEKLKEDESPVRFIDQGEIIKDLLTLSNNNDQLQNAHQSLLSVKNKGAFSFELQKPDIEGWRENHHRKTSSRGIDNRQVEKMNRHIADRQMAITLDALLTITKSSEDVLKQIEKNMKENKNAIEAYRKNDQEVRKNKYGLLRWFGGIEEKMMSGSIVSQLYDMYDMICKEHIKNVRTTYEHYGESLAEKSKDQSPNEFAEQSIKSGECWQDLFHGVPKLLDQSFGLGLESEKKQLLAQLTYPGYVQLLSPLIKYFKESNKQKIVSESKWKKALVALLLLALSMQIGFVWVCWYAAQKAVVVSLWVVVSVLQCLAVKKILKQLKTIKDHRKASIESYLNVMHMLKGVNTSKDDASTYQKIEDGLAGLEDCTHSAFFKRIAQLICIREEDKTAVSTMLLTNMAHMERQKNIMQAQKSPSLTERKSQKQVQLQGQSSQENGLHSTSTGRCDGEKVSRLSQMSVFARKQAVRINKKLSRSSDEGSSSSIVLK